MAQPAFQAKDLIERHRIAVIAWTPPGFRAFDLGADLDAADTGTSDDSTAVDNNKATNASTA